MKVRMKRIDQQAIVITGAGSGIGKETARLAASHGARVVLVGRGEAALDAVASEIRAKGGEAITVVADVGKQGDHDRIVEQAVSAYGGIDTWVNNAGVTIFGKFEDVPLDDQRQLFETNYWGVVYGSMAALAHMKQKGGGTIINLGSELSDISVPLQGAYSASKHAVKGFTDAFRMELLHDQVPVSVTLIKPAAVATGYTAHARNYMDVQPDLPAPVYSPLMVAKAILFAAQNSRRDIYVGGASRAFSVLGQNMPALTDRLSGWLWDQQRTIQPAVGGADSLYDASGSHIVPAMNGRPSVYTLLATCGRPALFAGVAVLGFAAAVCATTSRR